MSQRFVSVVTPSANNSCLEQEYTYNIPDNKVGAVIIYAIVKLFHIFDHHFRRDHRMKFGRPNFTRGGCALHSGRAPIGFRGSWYDDSQ